MEYMKHQDLKTITKQKSETSNTYIYLFKTEKEKKIRKIILQKNENEVTIAIKSIIEIICLIMMYIM